MKIGITLDLSQAFWSNGLQQNIVFLYDLLSRDAENECLYISSAEPSQPLSKPHSGMVLTDLLADSSQKLDILIIAGFDLLPPMYDILKARNPDLKIILIHYGNKLMDDIHYGISSPSGSKGRPLSKPKYLSQIWISPHHSFATEYIKTYYNCAEVYEAPYIWDPFFIQDKVKELEIKDLSPYFSKEKSRSICIFEPNISHIKTCLIPIMICERMHQLFPHEIDKVSVFSCEGLRQKPYFKSLMDRLSLVNQKPSPCYFNNRWGSLTALSKFGSVVVSHQTHNELNYSHLEALHLGLPLIHNSPTLMDAGYYYPDFDIETGAKQLKVSMEVHEKNIDWYKGSSKTLLHKYSPYNEANISGYITLLKKA